MSFYNYIFGPKLYMEYRGVPEAQVKPIDDLICIINMQLHFICFSIYRGKCMSPAQSKSLANKYYQRWV